nr:MAG TPA: hypothetical protein [Caudoviricetes sp.]
MLNKFNCDIKFCKIEILQNKILQIRCFAESHKMALEIRDLSTNKRIHQKV